MREYTLVMVKKETDDSAVLTIKAEDVDIVSSSSVYNFLVEEVTVAFIPIERVKYITSKEVK